MPGIPIDWEIELNFVGRSEQRNRLKAGGSVLSQMAPRKICSCFSGDVQRSAGDDALETCGWDYLDGLWTMSGRSTGDVLEELPKIIGPSEVLSGFESVKIVVGDAGA